MTACRLGNWHIFVDDIDAKLFTFVSLNAATLLYTYGLIIEVRAAFRISVCCCPSTLIYNVKRAAALVR